MNKNIVSFALVTVALTMAACTGGRSRLGSAQCPKNFNPIQMEIPAAGKMQMQSTTFADGKYKVARSWLFFKGDPTPQHPDGFQVMVKNDVPEKSKASAPISRSSCFRNAAVDKPYSAKASTISEIEIKDGRVVSSSAQPIGFEMDENGKFKLLAGASEVQSKAVDQMYVESSETFVMHYSDDLYEIRTKGRGENGEYTMSTVLFRHQ